MNATAMTWKQAHMDSATRRRGLILGALSGRQVGCPKIFVESLAALKIDADLVIFHHDISPSTKEYLLSRGAVLAPFHRLIRTLHGPVHTWRFVLFARYAAEHGRRYDFILTSDLRDVAFQSDPFDAVGNDTRVRFFLESDAYTNETEFYYNFWMNRFIPKRYHALYGKMTPSCCGVVLGGAAEMAAYLAALSRRIRRMNPFLRRKLGADSALHNLIAYVTHDAPGMVVSNNELVATMALEPPDTYHLTTDGFISCGNGSIPSVCHQYDRIPGMTEWLIQKYATNDDSKRDD